MINFKFNAQCMSFREYRVKKKYQYKKVTK